MDYDGFKSRFRLNIIFFTFFNKFFKYTKKIFNYINRSTNKYIINVFGIWLRSTLRYEYFEAFFD